MAQNVGKIFEDSIKKSMPDYALLYRLPDPVQLFNRAESFSGGKLRFSHKNPFDFILWCPPTKTLYALEMKSVSGKSISFERSKEENGVIHHHQIEGLNNWNKYDGTVCGLIIEFRKLETTIFIEISDFHRLISAITKKSFNIDDLNENNIPYIIIEQEKRRTRYTYNIDKFLCGNTLST